MVGSYWVCHWKKTFWVGGCDGIGGLAYLLFCAAYWSRQPRVFQRLSRSCYHLSKLRCRRYLKSFLVEDRPVEQILHIPYQDCWYPINARSQSSVCLGGKCDGTCSVAMHPNPKFIKMPCLTILYLAQSQLHDQLVQISSWHHGLYMDGTGPSANIIILTKHRTGAYDFGIRDHILKIFFMISLFLKFVFIIKLIIYLLLSQTTTALHKQLIMYIRSSVIYNMIFLCF